MNKPEWFPDWSGECLAIVAAGPSVTPQQVDALRNRIHVAVINESYRLAKWADILYACDHLWWLQAKGAKDFSGLKITQDDVAVKHYPELKKVTVKKEKGSIVHDLLMDAAGEVGGGGHSGFQMINLSAQFGVTGILLVGFDMCGDCHKPHWHGRHPSPMTNPIESNFQTWRKNLAGAKPKLDALGIDVVNCSPISTLTTFPKISVEEALKRWTL
jgi:hypothetical protein